MKKNIVACVIVIVLLFSLCFENVSALDVEYYAPLVSNWNYTIIGFPDETDVPSLINRLKSQFFDVTSSDTGKVVSGMTFEIDGDSYTAILLGDVNFTGKVDATDYLQVKLNLKGYVKFNEIQELTADSDLNGRLTATDYLRIKRHCTGSYSLYQRFLSFAEPTETGEFGPLY